MRFKARDRVGETILRELKRERYLTQWHPFFCLIPRRVGDEIVWLEHVQRKGRWHEGWYDPGYWEWEYRIPIITRFLEDKEAFEQQRNQNEQPGNPPHG